MRGGGNLLSRWNLRVNRIGPHGAESGQPGAAVITAGTTAN